MIIFIFLTFGKQQAIAKYTASKKKVYDLVLVNLSPVSWQIFASDNHKAAIF